MILEALVAYYMAALSKRDLKPFLKFKTFLLGFAGCCFSKIALEGRLNHETYVTTLIKNQNVNIEIVYTSDTEISKSKLFTLLTLKMSKSKLFTLLSPKFQNRNCLLF